ncbi:MAG: anti-sigma factor antagonist [Planctomycetes bacterium]|nr:anti-sigma factor antagonist [Planctomycetota bacterium]
MSADDRLIRLALKLRFVTQAQVDEARKLQSLLGQNGLQLEVPEILVKKEFIDAEQFRLLKVATQQEEVREEDQAVAQFLIRGGFLAEDKVREALAAQESLYQEGRPVPRLQEILQQKGLLNPEQTQIIQRARQQIEGAKALPKSSAAKPPSEASIPSVRPGASSRRPAGGQIAENCRVALRKSPIRDPAGQERTVYLVDVEGALDGHTFRFFDEYVNGLIDEGRSNLILNCEKLEYVSSAGIGVLAGAVKRCRDAKGDLRLCAVQERVKKIVNLVGLQSMLRIYENERGALVSFKYM